MTVHPATAQPDPPDRRRRWRKLLPWLALAVFCALFAFADRSTELARRRHAAADGEHKTKYIELVQVLGPYISEPKPVIREKFNRGQPFLVESPTDGAYGTQMDAGHIGPRYAGWTVNMSFRRGNLYGFELVERNYTRFVGPSNTWVQMERARQGLVVLAAGLWGLTLFTLPFARRWRRPIAQVCLGAVIVAAVAWSLYPYRPWDRATLVAPLPLAIAGAALVTLVLVLWPAGPASTAGAWRACQGCGYDLTGNESGICPECGRPTPRLLVDRWRDEAGRIAAVADEVEAVADEPNGVGDDGQATAGDEAGPSGPRMTMIASAGPPSSPAVVSRSAE